MSKMWDGIGETRLIKTGNSDTDDRATAHLKIISKVIKMKIQKTISIVFSSMLMLALCLTTSNSFAQTKDKPAMMKDCCMMKDGKMMVMKDGKTMPMEKDMTMKNGTKCMTNGECTMKDGKKMMMKEGDCMEMSGKMGKCSMMNKSMKSSKMKKNKNMATVYTCPMHPEVTSNKAGKCPKCGMDLVKKN
ncbi:MAG: DUF6799 domain-containing protein [Ferruginibacter sp.]